jgi:hemoglobin/transferrin/lactoferrin receptor protein
MYKRIIIFTSILFQIFRVAAQEAGDSAAIKTVSLDEVVISVNKFSETKKTLAQQVAVIDRMQIRDIQAQNTADLLTSTGSVFVQKSQMGGGSPVIRGFEASRIVLVVDGVRMNNIIYRAGHLQNIITLDNASLERVEVLYGPSSTIYGSDALGGVIHFYTIAPRFAAEDQKTNIGVNAFARYGSVNNEMTGHLDFNIGGKKFASLTSVTYSCFGDLKSGRNQNPFYEGSFGERPYYAERINGVDSLVENSNKYKQVQSAYKQYDLMQKFAFKQSDKITHKLNVQFSNSGDVPRYDRLTDVSGGGLKYAEWYYGPQTRLLGAYDFEYSNVASFFNQIHAGISYQMLEESRHQRRFGKDNLQHRIENVNVIGANVDLQRNMKKHVLRLGADLQYNTLKSTANEEDIVSGVSTPLDTRYPDGVNTMLTFGIYASHTWQISPVLALTDGLRVGYSMLHSTFVDTTFFNFPFSDVHQNEVVYSGSLGLIHAPSDQMKLSFLVSTGYRTPNVDDLSKVFESSAGTVIVPNPDLKPEKTVNFELGLTRIFEKKVLWENSIYYTHFFDAIVADRFTYDGKDSLMYDGSMSLVLANQNKRQAYLYGISSELNAQLADHLNFIFGINYIYGRIKTDSSDAPMDHIPPLMMHAGFAYKYKNFGADFNLLFNGSKRLKDYYLNGEDNEQYATPMGMPAWLIANLHLSYKTCKYITIQAGIDNIFDTQYRVFASGINAPGRNIFATLRFHY